ncbi:hypothetical protein [Raoultella ornithinolytica]|uniref:hypothetical protein n=1 Tax=Raoultella ornithinolytica TaxID=54291 RepID=UPI002259E2FD|nr:hypothetical protein [Raoultella ornithinolytica]MCX3408802.1 hypothetical protein [Raoultella ornithinolytica]
MNNNQLTDLRTLVLSEVGDFFAGFGSPGEPRAPEEMQRELSMRLGRILNDHIVNYPRCEALVEILRECRIARDEAQAELQERRRADRYSEPVVWINGCNKSVPAALRYLAENPRPIGGESSFNTAHLYQLAREIELMAEAPLYRYAQPAPVVPEEKPMPNPLSMYAVDAVAAIAEAKGWNACRAAMLQHQPQNAQQNIPENIPGGLVEAVNNLLNNDGSRGCYDAMECGTAREKIELWLAQRQRWEEQRKANLSAGNSPVIPDGYVMVPKEPTQAMCAAFNDSDYGRKSLRERYVAMPAAAPQEVPDEK